MTERNVLLLLTLIIAIVVAAIVVGNRSSFDFIDDADDSCSSMLIITVPDVVFGCSTVFEAPAGAITGSVVVAFPGPVITHPSVAGCIYFGIKLLPYPLYKTEFIVIVLKYH